MTVGSEYDDDDIRDDADLVDVEEEETEAPARSSSPLRIILLVLLLLVVICCGGALLLRNFTGDLVANLPIPLDLGVGPVENGDVVAETPEVPEVTTEEVLPSEGEPGPDEEALPGAEQDTPTAVVQETPEAAEEEVQEEAPDLLAQEPTAPAPEETLEPSLPETVEPEATVESLVEETAETVTPVPGPTVTSTPVLQPQASPAPGLTVTSTPALPPQASPEAGPTVVVTVDSCQNNDAPTADANGPYTAMLGKGLAFVTLDASGSTDPDGSITEYRWDFGDSSTPGTGRTVTHGYSSTGVYTATLTVTDNCGASGESTATVTITSAIPPATATPLSSSGSSSRSGTAEATVQPASAPAPASATPGFCYLVQAGDTLSSIGASYGVSVQALASVNDIAADYLVAGQGLFIPSGEISPGGSNVYQIQPGDTLAGIASRCGMSSSGLAAANGMMAQGSLVPGQFITIPTGR